MRQSRPRTLCMPCETGCPVLPAAPPLPAHGWPDSWPVAMPATPCQPPAADGRSRACPVARLARLSPLFVLRPGKESGCRVAQAVLLGEGPHLRMGASWAGWDWRGAARRDQAVGLPSSSTRRGSCSLRQLRTSWLRRPADCSGPVLVCVASTRCSRPSCTRSMGFTRSASPVHWTRYVQESEGRLGGGRRPARSGTRHCAACLEALAL